ncbi:McrB family protein [Saccharicrinis sp. 156]|uniref:McrB family protein n=1 Tax=Saccharicrinis sp. 156 TaxID=3417574 RepID=UPI003D356B57
MTIQELITKAGFFNKIKDANNLFDELKKLSETELKNIEQQIQPDSVFRPVVLLRFLVVQLLLQKKEVNASVIDELKTAIENRDISEYYDATPEFIESLTNYKDSKKGMFPQWKNPFNILYTFFYPEQLKSDVTECIKEIGQQIIDKNNLEGVVIHPVGFDGSQNYGDDAIWGAVIPEQAENVQKAYQIFFRVSESGVNGGLLKGHKLANSSFKTNDLKYDSWDDYLDATTAIVPQWKEENSKVNFTLHADEKDFIKRIKQSSISGNELFFNSIDKLINDLQIPEEDSLIFSVSQNRLSFHIGSRYCLSLFKDKFGFISSKKLDFSGVQEEPFNGEPEAYWYKNNTGDTLLKYFNELTEATQNEFNRGHSAKNESYKNVAFQKAVFDKNYRQRIFNQHLIPKFKGDVWKLGCVWKENGTKIFYDYLVENKFVLGVDKFKYKVGDLIAITEGYNVKAIGQIKETPIQVTKNADLQNPLESYEVDFEDWVNVAPADIVELSSTDEFEYKLRQGIRKVQQKGIKEKVISLWYRYNSNPNNLIEEKNSSMMKNIPLNQILYGPPGTGKTYNTINHALDICGENLSGLSRQEIKELFEQKVDEGQIVFTTFHQSMTYEDFVEGIKPIEPEKEGDPVIYRIEEGIFRKLCVNASFSLAKENESEETESVLDFSLAFDKFVEEVEEKLSSNEEVELETKSGGKVLVDSISPNGNVIIKHHGGSRPYTVSKARTSKLQKEISDLDDVNNINDQFRAIIGGSNSSAYWSVLNAIRKNNYKAQAPKKEERKYTWEDKKQVVQALKKDDYKGKEGTPHILIIDEINRGNVSQIFGELITLIEKDKRLGTDEALQVQLPYSKEWFGVPPNLYIIGTMNTADRSVEALDTALRRRFSFKEMPPVSELLEPKNMILSLWNKEDLFEVAWEDEKFRKQADALYDLIGINKNFEEPFHDDKLDDGLWTIEHFDDIQNNTFTGINLKELLEIINKRIEKLLDKDHMIGHSYFLNVTSLFDLKVAFQNNIIPLLQEYFFGDYGKIGLVLGEGFFTEKIEEDNDNFFASFNGYDSGSLVEREVYHLLNTIEMNDVKFKEALNTLLRK